MICIANEKVMDKDDGLKWAYAFMQTKLLNLKECAFLSPNPSQFDSKHLFPRDMYTVSYKDTVPVWESFKTNLTHISAPAFSCVAAVDKRDQKRVVCAIVGDVLMFNIYGDYETEAKAAFDDIVQIRSTLK